MQGRLAPPAAGRVQCFPREHWADEFANAAAAKLDAIEWIYDAYGVGTNPVETAEGIAAIRKLSEAHAVAVRSLCADYWMDFPLVRSTASERRERLEKLAWLIGVAKEIGVVRVVLPFVDQSAIRDQADSDAVVDCLNRLLPAANAAGIELHLETSLAPGDFAELLDQLPDAAIRVNYDSGNSASLGYRPEEEFAAYGERVGSVHIKDRLRGGGTVPLGQGDADFDAVFAGLRRLSYGGDFILQVARGPEGDEVAWARRNQAFLKRYWN